MTPQPQLSCVKVCVLLDKLLIRADLKTNEPPLDSLDQAEFSAPMMSISAVLDFIKKDYTFFTGHKMCPIFTKIGTDDILTKVHNWFTYGFRILKASVTAY